MLDQIFYTQGINLIFSEKRTRSNLLKSAQGPRRPYFYWSIRDGASLSKAPLRNGEIRSFSNRLKSIFKPPPPTHNNTHSDFELLLRPLA